MAVASHTQSVGWFFLRLYPHYKEHRWQALAAFVLLGLVHVVETVIPSLVQRSIDLLAAGDGRILGPTLAVTALAGLRLWLMRFGRRHNALLSIEISRSLRVTLYAHLQTLGRNFYARYTLGDLMARSSNDILTIWRFFRSALYQVISLVAIVIVAPIFMASQSLQLTALVLPLLCCNFAVSFLLARRIRSDATRVQRGFGQLTALVDQSLKGIRTIQLHGQEAREHERMTEVAHSYARSQQHLARLNAALRASMQCGGTLITLAVLGYGGQQVLAGKLSVGTLTGFVTYLALIMGVLNNASWPVFSYLNAASALARVFQLLDEHPEIVDVARGRVQTRLQRVELCMQAVSYSYPSQANRPSPRILDAVSLTIAPGELVTILGKVGSGKTTVLRLLSRQLEPTTGRLTLDGCPFANLALSQLRQTIALVPQEAFLFSTSLSENISYDDPERPRPVITEAAHAAQLQSTIAALAQGLSTVVGERGWTLSGGQRQRASIARGLIRQTPILLLDDCFSALDADTEAELVAQLRQLRRGLTTVLVSHRVSAARHADRICVLHEGRIVETGRHDDLLARAGHYARLTRLAHMQPKAAS